MEHYHTRRAELLWWAGVNIMSGDSLKMGYFDVFDNGPLNKYKKILKMKKSL
jgi:hypothetical protein